MKTAILPLLLLLAVFACAPDSFAKKPKPKNAINTFMDLAPTISEDVVAPLGEKGLPELNARITSLREKLLDEAAKNPAASQDTYKAAANMCDAWLKALIERQDTYTAESKTHSLSKADAKEGNYFNDAEKKAWLERSAQLKRYFEQFYAQVGALRRQPAQVKAVAGPAS